MPCTLRNSASVGDAEVVGVHAERAQRLHRRRPQVEDVPGRPGLPVALVDDDLVTCLQGAEGGGHAGRPGAEDGDAAAGAEDGGVVMGHLAPTNSSGRYS